MGGPNGTRAACATAETSDHRAVGGLPMEPQSFHENSVLSRTGRVGPLAPVVCCGAALRWLSCGGGSPHRGAGRNADGARVLRRSRALLSNRGADVPVRLRYRAGGRGARETRAGALPLACAGAVQGALVPGLRWTALCAPALCAIGAHASSEATGAERRLGEPIGRGGAQLSNPSAADRSSVAARQRRAGRVAHDGKPRGELATPTQPG